MRAWNGGVSLIGDVGEARNYGIGGRKGGGRWGGFCSDKLGRSCILLTCTYPRAGFGYR